MNKIIKELIEQADIKFDTDIESIDVCVLLPSDLEKFAELIVLKCADLCTDQYYTDGGGFGLTTADMRCAELIKKHFGVEE